MEVVTLKEIDKWVGLHNKGKGKELPQEWKSLITEYINKKKRFAEIHRKKLKSVEADIELAEGYYYLITDGVKFE